MSTNKLSMTLFNEQQGHQATQALWRAAKAHLSAGRRMVMTLAPEKRSDAQNNVMWARLTDVAEQIEWYGKKLTPQDWKHIFSSSLAKLEVVPNLDGTGFVALGLSTSSMTKSELQDLNELIMAFGSARLTPVRWSVASLCGEPEFS